MDDFCNFCVIGTGITGLTVDLLLSEKGCKVFLLGKDESKNNSSQIMRVKLYLVIELVC